MSSLASDSPPPSHDAPYSSAQSVQMERRDTGTSDSEPDNAWADLEARFPFLRDDGGLRKRPRKLLTSRQSSVLHKILERTHFPSTDERKAVAKELGLSPRKVQVFFQNKRQKHRRMTLSAASELVALRHGDDVRRAPQGRTLPPARRLSPTRAAELGLQRGPDVAAMNRLRSVSDVGARVPSQHVAVRIGGPQYFHAPKLASQPSAATRHRYSGSEVFLPPSQPRLHIVGYDVREGRDRPWLPSVPSEATLPLTESRLASHATQHAQLGGSMRRQPDPSRTLPYPSPTSAAPSARNAFRDRSDSVLSAVRARRHVSHGSVSLSASGDSSYSTRVGSGSVGTLVDSFDRLDASASKTPSLAPPTRSLPPVSRSLPPISELLLTTPPPLPRQVGMSQYCTTRGAPQPSRRLPGLAELRFA